jgi:hypothetical protein
MRKESSKRGGGGKREKRNKDGKRIKRVSV